MLDRVTWDSPSMQDEIFGPVLPILEYDNLGEVIHRIRQLPKPLAAYMFTENERLQIISLKVYHLAVVVLTIRFHMWAIRICHLAESVHLA